METFALFGMVACALFSSMAFAETPSTQWELTGSTNAYIEISHHTDDDGNPFSAGFGAGASYFVTPQWELGTLMSFSTDTGGTNGQTFNAFQFTAGPTFNLSADAANSFFATAQAGLSVEYFGGSGNTYLPFTFFAGIGRRVEIVSHVSWTPEVTFWGHTRSSAASGSFLVGTTHYELMLFQFSILL